MSETSAGRHCLFVDVTEYFRFDWRTGIQRVTSAFIDHLSRESAEGAVVTFFFVDAGGRFRKISDIAQPYQQDGVYDEISVRPSDVLFFLDFSPRLLPKQRAQLKRWRQMRVRMVFLVHDFLPDKRPEWFTARGVKNFRRWATLLAEFGDAYLCLSESIKSDLDAFLQNERGRRAADAIFKVRLNLGWEITGPNHSCVEVRLSHSEGAILMVGTIEPRKGHLQLLRAFDELWAKGCNTHLVFVGRPGWGTTRLQDEMRSHCLLNEKFFWMSDATDTELMVLYRLAAGVVVASEDEGFGLPLREALQWGKPVLARDIPVFRENIAGDVTYFRGHSPQSLAEILMVWIDSIGHKAIASYPTGRRAISYSLEELDMAIFDTVL